MGSRGDLSRRALKAVRASGKPVTTQEIGRQERRIAAEHRAFQSDNYDRSKGGKR